MSQSKSARRKRRRGRAAVERSGSSHPMQDYMARLLREAGETPARQAARRERFAALYREHPGKYVAFREVWKGDVLTEPFLLAVGDTIADVERQLDDHPPAVQADAVIDRLLPPGRPLIPDARTRHRLPRPVEAPDAPPD